MLNRSNVLFQITSQKDTVLTIEFRMYKLVHIYSDWNGTCNTHLIKWLQSEDTIYRSNKVRKYLNYTDDVDTSYLLIVQNKDENIL